MSTTDLGLTAHSIVASGKGIPAADETPGTWWRRSVCLTTVRAAISPRRADAAPPL